MRYPSFSGSVTMPRRITRYDNRKLYDTETSEYVSLADIAELVRNGETVKVVDKTTGQDITAQTLMQVILEEGKRGRQVLPSELLHDLVRRSEEALDTGLEQIRSTIDDLKKQSVERLKRLVQSSRKQELDELRQQLHDLEQRLSGLLNEVDDGARKTVEKQAQRTVEDAPSPLQASSEDK